MLVNNQQEFLAWFGAEDAEQLSKAVYKSSLHGLRLVLHDDSVVLIAYVEGAEWEGKDALVFPFDTVDYSATVSVLEQEADWQYHIANNICLNCREPIEVEHENEFAGWDYDIDAPFCSVKCELAWDRLAVEY